MKVAHTLNEAHPMTLDSFYQSCTKPVLSRLQRNSTANDPIAKHHLLLMIMLETPT